MNHWSVRPLPGWPLGGDEVRWGVGAAVACLLGVQAFAILWFGGVLGLIYGDDPPDAVDRPLWQLLATNGGLWIGYLVGPFLVRRLTESGDLRDFDLRAGRVQALGAAVLGVVAQLVLLPALYWVVLLVVDGDPSETATALVDRVDTGLDAVLLVIAVVVIAPIVEEWFYRGLVLPTVARRFGLPAGVIATSAVFALVHGEPILLPGLFVFALLLAWLTVTTGRIGPAIIAHMTFNLTTVVQLLSS